MDIIVYNRATVEDSKEIIAFVRQAIAKMEEENVFQWDHLYPTEEDFRTDIQEGWLYTGKIGNEIAVVFAYNDLCDEDYKNGKWTENAMPFMVIHRLCVNPKFQKQGIAKKTMLYIQEHLTGKEIRSIRLDAFTNNPGAVRLYEQLGYRIVGDAVWRKGRFYLMEKVLPFLGKI